MAHGSTRAVTVTRWRTTPPAGCRSVPASHLGRSRYEGLRLHIVPRLGRHDLRSITQVVRAWRQGLLDGGVGPTTVAKAYRLLRAVLSTAVDDELIQRNPCRIKGASVERTRSGRS